MHDVSIVVPVLNERDVLMTNLGQFQDLNAQCRDLIFVDGGSTDGSYEFLSNHFASVLLTRPGRALQMNHGARAAKGEIVLFLHVDTRMQLPIAMTRFEHALWGFFCIRLTSERAIFRVIERGINMRSKLFNVGTGDQCLFFNRKYFLEQGGFPVQPLMEDIEISRRYKRIQKPLILEQAVLSSSRRWETHGAIKTVLLMWSIQFLYKLGVSPYTLAQWYGYRPPLQTKI